VNIRALKTLAPGPVRRLAGRVRSAAARASVLGDLRRLAESGRPVIAGPWLGEVGFEILYWIPFLRWAEAATGLEASRVVALSRGGPSRWYAGLVGRYVDAFDLVSVEEFKAGNERRRREIGEQKQVRPTPFDAEVFGRMRAASHLEAADQLHPSLMYRLMQPYWWKHEPIEWAARHAVFSQMPAPALPSGLGVKPREYVAVKFYFNDCLPPTAENRESVNRTLRTLAAKVRVVSLSNGLDLDDHGAVPADGMGPVRSPAARAGARENLDRQTALVANAGAFIGTYGGFSYLAPFCGVPALGLYADPNGFDRAHLALAHRAFAAIGSPGLTTMALGDAGAAAVSAFVGRSVRA
jgi:hypothetical protein